jgi:intracellular sulfur oxidation DsrE/DsrF family protein
MARLASAVAAFGGAAALSPATAAATRTDGAPFAPARHPQDEWLEAIPGQHRFFFDTLTANGAGEGITFASNFLAASKSGYGLDDRDNAVVICLRHHATPFAFSDAVWAKYGAVIGERIKFTDPKTGAAPLRNVYMMSGYGMQLPNRDQTLLQIGNRGVHFAICDMATRAFAGLAAGRMQLKADDVYAELKASVIPNAHFVAAGIVAVNRAQERGYAVQHIG